MREFSSQPSRHPPSCFDPYDRLLLLLLCSSLKGHNHIIPSGLLHSCVTAVFPAFVSFSKAAAHTQQRFRGSDFCSFIALLECGQPMTSVDVAWRPGDAPAGNPLGFSCCFHVRVSSKCFHIPNHWLMLLGTHTHIYSANISHPPLPFTRTTEEHLFLFLLKYSRFVMLVSGVKHRDSVLL